MKIKTLVLGNSDLITAVNNSLIAMGSEVVRLYEVPEAPTVLKQEQFSLVIVDGEMPDLVNVCFRLVWICRLRVIVAARDIRTIFKELQPVGIDGYIGEPIEQRDFTDRVTATVQKGPLQFDKINALVVEDDHHIQEAIKLFFHILWPEADLTFCRDGQSGINEVRKKAPDIVLLDLGLPDMDGFEVLSCLRSFSNVPIVILTGQRGSDQIVRAMQSGADDYIVKPFKQIEIMLRIRKAISTGRLKNFSRAMNLDPA
jgi:DNA-binding response OmpR family regulator